MKKFLGTYATLAALLLLLSSCGVTKRIPDGEYLLTKNIISEDRSIPKDERIKPSELERFVQLQPNKRFLGTNLYIRLHSMASADTAKKNWWNRTLRKMGEAPVLLDSALISQSAVSMKNYTVYAGFYNAEVGYKVDTTSRKRAKVTYTVEQGEPYRIGNIHYEFQDEFLRPMILGDTSQTLLKSGDVLDGNVLSAERSRVVNFLRNNGYYKFVLSNLEFIGDSTVGDYMVDLTLFFRQHLAGYNDQGEPIYENNSIYRIRDVTINPDYDPVKAASYRTYMNDLDTTYYRGLQILHPKNGKPRVKRKVLRQAVSLYPNYIYSGEEVNQTTSNIVRLGFYKNTNIIFRDVPADTTASSEVTFIGDDGETTETTTEKYMSAMINCQPALKQSYKIELEGTTSSNFNALTVTLGYQNRNLLRGVELFDVSVRGGYEFTRQRGRKGSFEIGGSTSLSFPRFLFPFNVDRYNRTVNPRTKVELSISSQRRPYYHRTVTSATWGYSWSNRGSSSFSVRPIDLNLIKMNSVDQDFINNLRNDYLKSSYEEQIAGGISGSYVHNGQLKKSNPNSFLLRFNWETAGNLFNLISHTFNSPKKMDSLGNRYREILGIRYSQYVRFDMSISDRVTFGPRANLAWRLYGGAGFSYGNAVSIPYDRLFYSGGTNSMRGWIPRTLGPGNAPVQDEGSYNNQVGNMKLEANAEFRFPVWGFLNGALFFDLGNVWYLKEGRYTDDEGLFKLDRFYRQLGFNTGVGIRIDISVAVLRFDWGIPLHNPNRLKGERWIREFKFSDTVLNFGVGYPF